jgi:stage IV sporulation protein FB
MNGGIDLRRYISFSCGFFLSLAAMVLLLPLQWIMSAIFAAAIHELFHYVALQIFDARTGRILIRSWGAEMPAESVSRGRELICALAGPFGGLLLIPLLPIFPRLALCALVQSLYNLLPIYPLDGGRALQCFCALVLPPTYAAWVCSFVMWLFIGVLSACGIYLSLGLRIGFLPILLAVATITKAIYACNHRPMALQ